MFQSSPAPRRGRYLEYRQLPSRVLLVSILARAEARALPYYVINKTTNTYVSILARAEARALQFAFNAMNCNV